MWVQKRAFNLSKMGTTKNFCLRNVYQAFAGVGPKYPDARHAMYENRDKGTLHPLSTIPKTVAVPVFTDKGVWGHVMVCDRGTYYSDGKKVGKPSNLYQWGELLNGARVVANETPKQDIKCGDTVIVNGRGTSNAYGGGRYTKNFVNRKMKVISIVNGHYGCNQFNLNGGITGWWKKEDIKK